MGYPHRSPIDIVTFFAMIRKHQVELRPIVDQQIKINLRGFNKAQAKMERPGKVIKLIPFDSIVDWNNIYFNLRRAWN